ncbi:hypothetical protein EJ02DRAFT_407774 [Clathrospora elynae]|uniref:Uncharacterized protein n=1 Tax=Clathrospora elynae TaxID=706981 RepID=A0A6A5SGM4_9PLEO|nr:hypothetical protein EJ02DRAFT_407774 [Clathrospora elynae]
MAERPPKASVCGIENCRSRRFEEADDGFRYCSNGHRQQGGLARGEDDEDNYFGASKSFAKKKKEVREKKKKSSKHFTGAKALDLYLKCVQLILRHQVWFLIQEKGLPKELEEVVQGFWTLRIAQLADKIALEDPNSDSVSTLSHVVSTLEGETNEIEDTEQAPTTPRIQSRRRDRKLASAPNLQDCLALCYFGIITLGLPFTPGDIYAWVADGKLAYIQAIKLLPPAMKDCLPRRPPIYNTALTPGTPLCYSRFYRTVVDLQISYAKDHAIVWPALNVPLLTFRYIKELALPLELYDATKRVGELLGFDFAPHFNGKRLGIRHLPEAQLVGCLIVCIKLLYPLDNVKRYPRAATEPSATAMDWDEWYKIMWASKTEQRGEHEGFTNVELMMLRDKDVFDMDAGEMDQYLDFYAHAYLDEARIQKTKDTNEFQSALWETFPINGEAAHPPRPSVHETSLQQKLEVVKAVHGTMKALAAVSDEDTDVETLRPGQAYRSWKTVEELPEPAKMLYEKAAALAGLSMDMMLLAVFFTEAKMEQWRRAKTRRTDATRHSTPRGPSGSEFGGE